MRFFVSLLVVVLVAALVTAATSQSMRHVSPAAIYGERGQCPPTEDRERARNEIKRSVSSIISEIAAESDQDETAAHPCGSDGWRLVELLNMTDPSHSCPNGLSLTTYSKRTCGRSHQRSGCSSTTVSTGGVQYSQVCGRIRGYQFGQTTGFLGSTSAYRQSINGYYVSGVSVTHGDFRQHIWTFAAGATEYDIASSNFVCPCDYGGYSTVPSFVGNHYFCESGNAVQNINNFTLYSEDVLWDGQNCSPPSTCCQLNNPPWFVTTLPNPTIDNIELRLCFINGKVHADVALELVELYVK